MEAVEGAGGIDGRAMGAEGLGGDAGGILEGVSGCMRKETGRGVCRECGVRHFGHCHKCPHAGTRMGEAWEGTPCADCILSDGVGGHGRGISAETIPPGVLARAVEILAAMRTGTQWAMPESVRERFGRFLFSLADMGPSQFLAFQSWIRGETAAEDAKGRGGVSLQAAAQARRKMLRRLGLDDG